MNRWKHVSDKKLSVRKRGSFIDKKPVSEKADACPICGEPMKDGEYTGKKKSILDMVSSGQEGDFMAGLKEDGKVVWREVRKRSAS